MENNGKIMTYDELREDLEFTYGPDKQGLGWQRWDELRLEFPGAHGKRAAWPQNEM